MVWEGRAVVVVETCVLMWELGSSQAMPEMQGGTLVWRVFYVSARSRKAVDAPRRRGEYITSSRILKVDGLGHSQDHDGGLRLRWLV